MMRTLALAALLATAGLPVLAQSAEQKSAMVSAIAAAGCRVNASNNASVLSAAGLTEDQAAAVVQSLLDSGEAAVEGGDLVLKTGGC
ncbi:MAG: hypothetical protein OEM24_05950 [Paracoccaceae bacterium]|nr:hypothetical protein [Paracoccaceae bacterium]